MYVEMSPIPSTVPLDPPTNSPIIVHGRDYRFNMIVTTQRQLGLGTSYCTYVTLGSSHAKGLSQSKPTSHDSGCIHGPLDPSFIVNPLLVQQENRYKYGSAREINQGHDYFLLHIRDFRNCLLSFILLLPYFPDHSVEGKSNKIRFRISPSHVR